MNTPVTIKKAGAYLGTASMDHTWRYTWVDRLDSARATAMLPLPCYYINSWLCILNTQRLWDIETGTELLLQVERQKLSIDPDIHASYATMQLSETSAVQILLFQFNLLCLNHLRMVMAREFLLCVSRWLIHRSFSASHMQRSTAPPIFLLRILCLHSDAQNDGSLVATADHGGSVRLWDLRSGQVINGRLMHKHNADDRNTDEYYYPILSE